MEFDIGAHFKKVCTCITSIDEELGRLKGPGLAETRATHTHTAGIANLRLVDHHRDRAALNMLTVLPDIHQMFPNLLRNKRDACDRRMQNNVRGFKRRLKACPQLALGSGF